jgi:hypothetical protein
MAVLQLFYYIRLLARLLMKLTMSVSRKTCISAILYYVGGSANLIKTNNKNKGGGRRPCMQCCGAGVAKIKLRPGAGAVIMNYGSDSLYFESKV